MPNVFDDKVINISLHNFKKELKELPFDELLIHLQYGLEQGYPFEDQRLYFLANFEEILSRLGKI